VLVDDDVERVGLEHQREVVELHHPDPVLSQAVSDVLHELGRVLQVVEHGHARDHLGATIGVPEPERTRAEEVAHDVVALLDGVPGHVGGVEPEEAYVPGGEAIEQRAVVAADVDDQVAGFKQGQLLGGASDPVQVACHRLVDATAVPVRLVEDRARDRVAGLQEAARVLVASHVAADELERYRALHRLLAARLREGARDALLAQVKHGRQVGRVADPARGVRA
jgi:hypothetical protein